MKRNLVEYAEKGGAILERHKRMNLRCNEIFDILRHCGVQASADTSICVLCHVFNIGVAVGYSIGKLEHKK